MLEKVLIYSRKRVKNEDDTFHVESEFQAFLMHNPLDYLILSALRFHRKIIVEV